MKDKINNILSFGFGTPLVLLAIMAMIVIPLHPIVLDTFFTFNIVLSLIVLMAAVYAGRPLEFAAFPTVILIATLFRLALNLASTRVVLLNGHEGGDAAGKVIEAFGNVVIGGNYGVGIVVFGIMVIINFVVVTKGTGRVAEVSARFTLDAMPGKQMAIDADLSAGSIDQEEARTRRDELAIESDFYGSMDGASKFVKGDAVAGILILFINIIGGLVIGMGTHGLSLDQASEFYILLTIGDGLAAQIPSLLLSTATAIIVTRVSSSKDMGADIASQLIKPKGVAVTAGIMAIIGVIPGMPNFMFLFISGLLFTVYYFSEKKKKLSIVKEMEDVEMASVTEENVELSWDDIDTVDDLSLEVGYRLIPLVDSSQGGYLIDKIKGIRKKISSNIGYLIPSIHIKDNLDLDPDEYVISIMGLEIGTGTIVKDKQLAINPGEVYGDISGEKTIDPAYGLEAVWIDEMEVEKANSLGYTVVDSGTVIATHISKIIEENIASFFGRDETQNMINKIDQLYPKLTAELKADSVDFNLFVRILQRLLEEGIALLQFKNIASAFLTASTKTADEEELLKLTREGIGKFIISPLLNGDELSVLALNPELEDILSAAVENSKKSGKISIEPTIAEKLGTSLRQSLSENTNLGESPTILAPANLRSLLSGFFRHMFPELSVISYNEVPGSAKINFVGTIG